MGRAGHVVGGFHQQRERNAETLSSGRKADRPREPWSVCGRSANDVGRLNFRWPLALVVPASRLGVE